MTTSSLASADGLDTFIGLAKERGVPDDTLVALLQHSGWSRRRIYRGLGAFYTTALGTAPPARGNQGENAREAFMYLLNFITLGFWTTALGQLLYALIARVYPDTDERKYKHGLMEDTAWQIATIVIVVPVFLFLARAIGTELRRRPEAAESSVRVWMTYAALVIAAITVLEDGIWFLETLLREALTIRFVLDSLVLLIIGGGVFTYYLRSLRRAHKAR